MHGEPGKELYYTVADEVFERFPGYVRGVALVFGASNRAAPADLSELLRAEEAGVRARVNLGQIGEHERIKPWREAYRALGAKPSEFRSSIEAMARRVLRGDNLPNINALVDIGNIISLRGLVPAGAHALDVLGHDMWLRPASGNETFMALDGAPAERPEAGEIILAEGDVVLTRRWTWRQGLHTLVGMDSTAVEFNVDGLPPVSMAEVEDLCRQIGDMAVRYCGGRVRYDMLSAARRRIRISE